MDDPFACDTRKRVPGLLPYDPAKDKKTPREDDVAAAIDKLRAEGEAKKAAEESQEE